MTIPRLENVGIVVAELAAVTTSSSSSDSCCREKGIRGPEGIIVMLAKGSAARGRPLKPRTGMSRCAAVRSLLQLFADW